MVKNARLEIAKIFLDLLKSKLYSQNPIIIKFSEVFELTTYGYSTTLQYFKIICEQNGGKYISDSKVCVIHKEVE